MWTYSLRWPTPYRWRLCLTICSWISALSLLVPFFMHLVWRHPYHKHPQTGRAVNWQVFLQISLSHFLYLYEFEIYYKILLFTIHTCTDVKLNISKLHPIKNNITGKGTGKSFKCRFKNAAKKYIFTERQWNITFMEL